MYTYGHLKFQRANVYHVRLLATYINWSTLVRFAITNSCWKLQIKPLIVIKNGEKKTNSVHMQSSFSNQVRNIILKKITRKKYCRTTKCIDGCLAMHLPKANHREQSIHRIYMIRSKVFLFIDIDFLLRLLLLFIGRK